MKKIARDSWNIIERVLRRYQDNKTEYEILKAEATTHSSDQDGMPHGTGISKPTESAAILLSSPRAQRLEREINAVESVIYLLPPHEQRVIRIRFFSSRHKNTSYWNMERRCSYSERQMKRIVAKVVRRIGEQLGEI